MKKGLVFVLAIVLILGALTGCTGDPVAEDFEKFLNVDMEEVTKLYTDITTEAGRWEGFTTDEEGAESVEKVILPKLDESIAKLENINPATDGVKAIKEKYKKTMDTYKEGYGMLLEALKTSDEALGAKSSEKIEAGIKLLAEYNQAVESLAEAKELVLE